MVYRQAKVSENTQQAISVWETLLSGALMVKDNTNGKMERHTKANLLMENDMDVGS